MEKQTNLSTEKLDFEKVWLMFQETDRKFQETAQQFQETDKKFKETDRLLNNLMKKMSEVESRWGKFVESLVEGTLVKILNKKGIQVQHTFLRAKGLIKNKQYEIDIIAKNGEQVEAVEVKTTLSVEDVKHFMTKLKVFKEVFPEYSTNQVIGAVAYITSESGAEVYAAKHGLYVIKATNKSARIINSKDFQPKYW